MLIPLSNVYERTTVVLPEPNSSRGMNTIPDVPAFNWSFGCSATSAAMIAGYYDRNGYSNMYAGPTNGGVMPLDNSAWPDWVDSNGDMIHQCPLSATHDGLDGLTNNGHVDDYWIYYNQPGPDPWDGNWTEHTYGECTGDFMKTNQWISQSPKNVDGGTTFYNYPSGDPITAANMEGHGIQNADGGYGIKLFYESRGYTVSNMFNQYIKGYGDDPAKGFTYAQYCAEIDAGRPVMIHVKGHTMVGVGYDDATNLMYIHDTWDYNTHTMIWGDEYVGMSHMGVTIVEIEDNNQPPVLNPIGNKSINENQTLNFAVTADDPDIGDVLTLSADNLPDDATFNPSTGVFNWVTDYSDAAIYTDITFTVTDNGSPVMSDEETIQITVNNVTFIVNVSAGTGGSVSPFGDQTGDPLTTFLVTATPNTGYHFVDWTVTGGVAMTDGDATGEFAVTGVGTITANFAINTYTITFNAGPNGDVNGTNQVVQTIDHGDDCTPVTANPANGYHFVNWTEGGPPISTDNPLTVQTVTGDMTVTANFDINTYSVTFNAGANGTVQGASQIVQTVDHGYNSTPIEANPAVGFHFVDWTRGGAFYSTDNPLTVQNVTEDITVLANFAVTTYTITATAHANGSISPSGEVIVNHGDDQSFDMLPDPGYEVDYIEVDGGNVGPQTTHTFTNVTADHTIDAFFKWIPTITVASPNGGEELIVTSIHTITWTSTGSVGDVHIEYSSDNGSSWNNVVAGTENDGAYQWFVPNDMSPNCLVRISEVGGGGPVDVSDAVFSIQLKQLDIPLNSGWSMISFNVDPVSYSVSDVFGSISSLVMVKNNAGQVYMPDFQIDEIGNITIQDGYKVYTSAEEMYTVEGFKFYDYTTIPIPLAQGWNMIAYLPEDAMLITTALADIVGDIAIVKNNAGKTYVPDFGINDIITMNPGEGYKIRMKNARSFNYPSSKSTSGTVQTSGSSSPKQPTYFTFTENTGNNMTVIVPAAINPLIDGVAIENNDEIGVFTPAGLCVGGVVWDGANIAITVWGDDNQTTVVDGIKAGDTLQFRLWDASADKEYVAAVTYTSGSPDYSVDGISVLASLASTEPITVTVTAPNGGETLRIGETFTITWTSTGIIGDVLIEYTYDNGSNWSTIADSVDNTGSYVWTVPATLSTTCKVRISEASDSEPVDESDAVFTIDNATPIENGDGTDIPSEQFVVVPNPVDLGNNERAVSFALITEKKIIAATVEIFDAVGNLLIIIESNNLQATKQDNCYLLGGWNLNTKNLPVVGGGGYLAVLTVTESNGTKAAYRKIIGIKSK